MGRVPFLLVDDLEENLLSLEALLQHDDRLLLKARTGDQALELLLQHDAALALVDVQMPGLNGFELAELMRGNERTRRIPIIFVTAGTADGRRFRGYEAGAVDFIQKPIEPDILRSKVDVFFELYRQRQQLAEQRDELAAQAEALKDAARHKDLLLHEINHRIKNLFSLTTGLISLSARPATSVQELEADLRSRMGALSRAHALTLPDFGPTADPTSTATTVSALLKAIVAPHEHAQGPHVDITGSDAPLKGAALTSLALLLHEFTTNAAKYGALSSPSGRLTIDVSALDEQLTIGWHEHGLCGINATPEREGFGTRLEQAALSGLGGTISRNWREDGLSLDVQIPLGKLVV
ncbi:response regulator [Rhizobium sp. SSA_523]|uniref:response regulator n=1 Tax=Rhizobium sp. SSA_523 TaxID=2952477 RepID=UPI0020902E5C|nr:response regulator [Rhizobium sp. SSA_523]MCO5734176.1 response regulator [Rhizobium sp. SSA_523]WKC21543.1 response regulator [Rhizobium sp. SSA_523]